MRILVANKSDLPDQEVDPKDAQTLADQHHMEFYQTSAKSGENVETMFEDIAFKVMTKQRLKKERNSQVIGLETKNVQS